MLTSYHDDDHIYPAIRAGALSYLLKSVGLEELTEAVRKAARGEAVLHPHVAARLVRELHGAGRETYLLYASLSKRERQVLQRIAEGMSNAQIAASLVISERTVKSHVNNILGKLQVADRTPAAIYAWREDSPKVDRPGARFRFYQSVRNIAIESCHRADIRNFRAGRWSVCAVVSRHSTTWSRGLPTMRLRRPRCSSFARSAASESRPSQRSRVPGRGRCRYICLARLARLSADRFAAAPEGHNGPHANLTWYIT